MRDRDQCPTGCGRTVQPGKLMCFPCWREVPPHLQREVYRTWRAYLKARHSGIPGSGAEAFEAYLAVREQAIGAIQ